MKIFVSWSGEDSRQVAELLKDWIQNVVQEAEIWISSQDIGKGEKWSPSLWESLSEINFGILAVTKRNHSAPWILFEAGALSKSVSARVIPVLCNISRVELASSPLSQFQNAGVDEEDMFKVIAAINSACTRPADQARLKLTFGKWWPDFISAFKEIKFIEKSEAVNAGKNEVARLERIEAALESVMASMQRVERGTKANRSVANRSVGELVLSKNDVNDLTHLILKRNSSLDINKSELAALKERYVRFLDDGPGKEQE